ncbi:MAG: hypothetical protein KF855_02185 [Acidobacteria bacterium]|nr:hypothetical protein [Acidobacteriota bacterium]
MVVYAKKFIALAVLCVAGCIVSLAQDGGDMNYIDPARLDRTYIGRFLHIDFFRKSRNWLFRSGKENKNIDRISLLIGERKIEFVEIRTDDGFNNWFHRQCLESVDDFHLAGSKKVRISGFKLKEVHEKEITVVGYFNMIPFEQEFVFNRSDIAELLFLARDK